MAKSDARETPVKGKLMRCPNTGHQCNDTCIFRFGAYPYCLQKADLLKRIGVLPPVAFARAVANEVKAGEAEGKD